MPSWSGRTGVSLPTANLSNWLASGSGLILNEGFILSEGVILGESFILSESSQPNPANPDDRSLLGEP